MALYLNSRKREAYRLTTLPSSTLHLSAGQRRSMSPDSIWGEVDRQIGHFFRASRHAPGIAIRHAIRNRYGLILSTARRYGDAQPGSVAARDHRRGNSWPS